MSKLSWFAPNNHSWRPPVGVLAYVTITLLVCAAFFFIFVARPLEKTNHTASVAAIKANVSAAKANTSASTAKKLAIKVSQIVVVQNQTIGKLNTTTQKLNHQAYLRQRDTNALASSLCSLRSHSLITYHNKDLPLSLRENALVSARFDASVLKQLTAAPPTRCKNIGTQP